MVSGEGWERGGASELWGAGELWRSNSLCSGDLHRNSCFIPQSERGKRDSIAITRAIFSALSIIGALSIIISVIVKKQVLSPKVHPIFMLSIADFLLATLWTVGGGLWLEGSFVRSGSDRDGCFAILLATVIMECITVNMTCVYAMLAYSSIKQKDFSNVYSLFEKDLRQHVWRPCTTVLVYCIAWTAPVVIILVPFFSLDKRYELIKRADSCACWCIPFFGNIIPHSNAMDVLTARYLYDLSKFVLCYSIVILIHYVFGFTLLLVVYWMVLVRIKKMKKIYRDRMSHHNLYGATEAMISKGQSQAKTRVIIFLTVFLITGFFNVILSGMLIHYAITKHKFEVYDRYHVIPAYAMTAYIFQSITIPLQGFLNAIIYGWTREDFVKAIRTSPNNAGIVSAPPPAHSSLYEEPSSSVIYHTTRKVRGDSGIRTDTPHRDNTDTGILYTLSDNGDSD